MPSLPRDMAVTVTQRDLREVSWAVPSAEPSSSFSEEPPFTPGLRGDSPSWENWVKTSTAFTLGAGGIVGD